MAEKPKRRKFRGTPAFRRQEPVFSEQELNAGYEDDRLIDQPAYIKKKPTRKRLSRAKKPLKHGAFLVGEIVHTPDGEKHHMSSKTARIYLDDKIYKERRGGKVKARYAGQNAPTHWKDEHYLTIFLMRQEGCQIKDIIQELKVNKKTWNKWRNEKPAIDKFLQVAEKESGQTFHDYIIDRLDKDTKAFWKKIEKGSKKSASKKDVQKKRTTLATIGKHQRQLLFIHAVISTNFSWSSACRHVDISSATLDHWKREENFVRLLNEIEFHKKNFYEDKFNTLVRLGSEKAILMAAKNYNADRGYGDQEKVTHTGTISHEHSHEHKKLDIDLVAISQKLSSKCRKELMSVLNEMNGDIIDSYIAETPLLEEEL